MSYLALKLGSLIIKQVSKPIAKQITATTLSFPKVREGIVNIAQFYQDFSIRTGMRADGRDASRVFIGRIHPDKAIEQASVFISEASLLAIGGGLVYYEFSKKAAEDEEKRAKKEAKQAAKVEEARRQRADFNEKLDRQLERISSLEDRLRVLETPPPPPRRFLGLL